jgi:hypothetical protein
MNSRGRRRGKIEKSPFKSVRSGAEKFFGTVGMVLWQTPTHTWRSLATTQAARSPLGQKGDAWRSYRPGGEHPANPHRRFGRSVGS